MTLEFCRDSVRLLARTGCIDDGPEARQSHQECRVMDLHKLKDVGFPCLEELGRGASPPDIAEPNLESNVDVDGDT